MEKDSATQAKDDVKKQVVYSKNNYKKLNSHINFNIEKKKGNARKRDTSLRCCLCRKKFVLPFKPRFPEVYCDECFKKKDNYR